MTTTGDHASTAIRAAQDGAPAAASPADTKWWGHSMTVWGAVITGACAVLPAIGPALGLDLTPAVVRQLGDQAVHVIQAAGGLLGTAMAIRGRARAATGLARRTIRMEL